MTQHEAFTKYLTSRQHNGLPWEASTEELRACFDAGWAAHKEAIKQTDLFPGTLSEQPLLLPEVHSAEQPICSGKVVGSNPTRSCPSAEAIYAAYPRKIGKQAALKAIEKAAKTVAPLKLMQAVTAYAAAVAQWPAADKQFIPHPATWFNRGSYDDDPKEWVRGAAAAPSQFTKKYT